MTEKQPLNDPAAPPPYAPNPAPGGVPYPTGPQPVLTNVPAQGHLQGQPMPPLPPGGAYAAPPGAPPAYKEGVPPPAGYPVGAIPANTTVVVHQQQFNQFPLNCTCPNCHQAVVTTTVPETSTLTWLVAGGIFLFGGWVCCLCLIPFCIDDLKDVRHVCPSCRHTIGVYKRM